MSMAVFPKKPDIRNEADAREYIKYMAERIEFAFADLEKQIREMKEGQK